MSQVVNELRQKISDLERSQAEIKMQNQKLSQTLKNVSRKLILRLPISMESLEKGLMYDLIFPQELESWAAMASEGIIVDLRSMEDFQRDAIPGAINIGYESLAQKLDRFQKYQAILFVCDNGIKSVSACELLASKGFPFLYVLKGGMSHYEGRKVPGVMPEMNLNSEVQV